MMRWLLLTACLAFCCVAAHTQRSHVVHLELGGSGVLYSLNYDTRFAARATGLGTRIGLGTIPDDRDLYVYLPVQINYVTHQKHGLEIGAGLTFFKEFGASSGSQEIIPNGTFMYRYQGASGFNFRVGASPLFPLNVSNDSLLPAYLFWLWPGMSLGYRF